MKLIDAVHAVLETDPAQINPGHSDWFCQLLLEDGSELILTREMLLSDRWAAGVAFKDDIFVANLKKFAERLRGDE